MSHNIWASENGDGNRTALMANVYYRYMPDVIGVQEYASTLNNLSLLVSESYTKIDYSEEMRGYLSQGIIMTNMYTPIFYREDTLELLDKGFVLFDIEYNNGNSKGVAYAVFMHRASGERFTVLNTHFWWEQNGAADDAARVANAEEILKLKAALIHPIFAIGDFNCKAGTNPYTTLTGGGFVDVQTVAATSDNTNTHHAYPTYNSETGTFGGSPKPTGNYGDAIDHIFVNSENADNVTRFKVITDNDALNTSDHCPIFVDFDLGQG